MKLALDARTLFAPQRRGIGKTLVELYRRLSDLHPDWRVLAYHRNPEIADHHHPARWLARLGLPEGLRLIPRYIEAPGDRLHAWERWRLPWAAWRDRCDVLHCPANFAPAWSPVPSVATVHDLIPIEHSPGRRLRDIVRFERGVAEACRSAAAIVTPSFDTRTRLLDRFAVDPASVSVVPWSADPDMRCVPESRWHDTLQRHGVRPPFVLHFGAAEPRKNTDRLLDAWLALPRRVRAGWSLLVVGLDQTSIERHRQRLSPDPHSAGPDPSVHLLPYADPHDLPTLMSAAAVLAYPSLAEGFGLPILDAFAVGLPVLTSRLTSLPEVAGDAALLIDPESTASIAQGLGLLLTDGSLRNELIAAGHQRLRRYSWTATARAYADLLARVAACRRADRTHDHPTPHRAAA